MMTRRFGQVPASRAERRGRPGATRDGWQTAAPEETAPPAGADFERRATPGGMVVANHFAHNLAMSVLSLPMSPSLADVRGTLAIEPFYWKVNWRGALSGGQAALLVLNLAMIALGLTAAIRRDAVTGVLPLGAFLGYQLANAFGRTSGGRYGVPADWIIVMYFALGLAALVTWAVRALGLLASSSKVRAAVSRARETAVGSADSVTAAGCCWRAQW
jgi:hypothetical protein